MIEAARRSRQTASARENSSHEEKRLPHDRAQRRRKNLREGYERVRKHRTASPTHHAAAV
jgi:hypothetical protein